MGYLERVVLGNGGDRSYIIVDWGESKGEDGKIVSVCIVKKWVVNGRSEGGGRSCVVLIW